MSATSYGDCPKCKILGRQFDERISGKVDALYGEVPAADYRRLQKEAKKIENPYSEQPWMREDYEAWTDETGKLSFSYLGSCDRCGYEVSGSYEVTVDPTPAGLEAQNAADAAWSFAGLETLRVEE